MTQKILKLGQGEKLYQSLLLFKARRDSSKQWTIQVHFSINCLLFIKKELNLYWDSVMGYSVRHLWMSEWYWASDRFLACSLNVFGNIMDIRESCDITSVAWEMRCSSWSTQQSKAAHHLVQLPGFFRSMAPGIPVMVQQSAVSSRCL